MARSFPKAIVVGATMTTLFTIAVQAGARVCGHGENGIGWFLMAPWFAIFAPGFFVAKMMGWHWRVGDVYEVTMPIFIFMLFVNALIGAFLGWAFKSIYCVFKRDA
jgi:hypothetical protein